MVLVLYQSIPVDKGVSCSIPVVPVFDFHFQPEKIDLLRYQLSAVLFSSETASGTSSLVRISITSDVQLLSLQ